MIEELIVALVVVGCTAYALWTLMPSTLRRALAQQTMNWPWPEAIAARVKRAAQASNACGCSGCDSNKAAPQPGVHDGGVHTIQIHRRPKP